MSPREKERKRKSKAFRCIYYKSAEKSRAAFRGDIENFIAVIPFSPRSAASFSSIRPFVAFLPSRVLADLSRVVSYGIHGLIALLVKMSLIIRAVRAEILRVV